MWVYLILQAWTAQDYLRAADRYLTLGRYETARQYYRCSQSVEPGLRSDCDLLIRQGIAQLYSGRPEAALSNFKAAVKWGGKVEGIAEGWYWLGRGFFELDDYPSASRCFARAIEISPKPKFLYPFGIACYREGRYRDAFNLLQNLYELAPDSDPDELRYLLGLCALRLEDYSTARFYLEPLNPSAETWYRDDGIWLLAFTRYCQGDRTGAQELLVKFKEEMSPELKEKAHLLLGTIQVEQGEHRAAQLTFESMLANLGLIYRADLLLRAGVAALNSEEYERAAQHFSALLTEFPGSDLEPPALFYGARTQEGLGNFSRAAELYRSLFFYYPQHPYQEEALWGLSTSYFKGHDYFSAAQELQNFVNAFPDSPHQPEALYRLSIALFELGRGDEALDRLDELIAHHPSTLTHEANYLKGRIHLNSQRFEAARRSFRKVGGRLRTQALKSIADSYYEEGRFERAIGAYQRLIDANPPEGLAAKARYQQELCRFRLGEYNSRKEALEHYLSHHPESSLAPQVQLELGLYHLDQRDLPGAIREFQNFLVRYPRSPLLPRVMEMWGDAELELGHQEAAITAYNQLIRRFPKSSYAPQAYMGLARAYSELGRYGETRVMLERLCSGYPDSPLFRAARLKIVRSYRMEAQFKKAQSELNEYFRRFGPTPDGYRERGELERAQGRFKDALKSFKTSAELWGSARDETALDLLAAAECARLIGELKEARDLLWEASSRAQDERLRVEARRRLQELER